jgi:glucose/arabinose dehydrogenase
VRVKGYLIFLIIFSSLSPGQTELKIAFPNLSFFRPVDIQNAGDGSNRLFIVEQPGIIKVIVNTPNVSASKDYLNITDRVSDSGNEMGLLGLAFHPNYENNGYFYVNYTASNPRRTVISRFKVTSNPDSADENSEQILLTYEQPYSNHNGGQITFGADNYLYISSGDGGDGGDPHNYGQSKFTLLGKILRIDVNNTEDGLNYAIPSDNPFKDNSDGYKEEIFAFGLRNPWRFSIDPVTSLIWCADVGQDNYEEINIIGNGKNYGWRCYEGYHNFNTSDCNSSNYEQPIWEYDHGVGNSITGGYVYRGVNIPELYGKYIYSDFISRKVWALEYDGNNPVVNQYLFDSPASPSSFGVDEDNEIYIATFNSKIYKLSRVSSLNAPTNLTITLGDLGVAILNWEDNSNNETGFKIERKSSSSLYYLLDSVSADITTYIDISLLDTSSYRYRVYAYNDNGTSPFSNQSSVVTSVPVELISFKAKASNNKIVIEWSTASELNNKGYYVERYLNDRWHSITFLKGNGTATEKNYYEYADDFSQITYKGIVRYRLKQLDFDGTFTHTNEIAVEVDFTKIDYLLEQNYPNPFNPSTTIKYNIPEESDVEIKIYNILGKLVDQFNYKIKPAGFYKEEWTPSGLTSGVYYINLKAQSLVSGKSFNKIIKAILIK